MTPLCRHPADLRPGAADEGLALCASSMRPNRGTTVRRQQHYGRQNQQPCKPSAPTPKAHRHDRPLVMTSDRMGEKSDEIRHSWHGQDRAGILPWPRGAHAFYGAGHRSSAAPSWLRAFAASTACRSTPIFWTAAVGGCWCTLQCRTCMCAMPRGAEAGKHVIMEKPAPGGQTEEPVNLARHKRVFLFEAITTQYLENTQIRELLPRINMKLVRCNFSQYSAGTMPSVQAMYSLPLTQPVPCVAPDGSWRI